jgi:hypothetical protein
MELPENFQYHPRTYEAVPFDRLMSLNRATIRGTPEHTHRFYPGTDRVTTDFFLPLDIIQQAAYDHIAHLNENLEELRRMARHRKRTDDEPARPITRKPDDDEDPGDDSTDHSQSPTSPPSKRMAQRQTPTGSPSTRADTFDGVQLEELVAFKTQFKQWQNSVQAMAQFETIMMKSEEEKNKIMKHHIETTQRMQKQSQRMHEDHMQHQTRMMAALESQAKVVTPGTGAGVDTAGIAGLLAALLGALLATALITRSLAKLAPAVAPASGNPVTHRVLP